MLKTSMRNFIRMTVLIVAVLLAGGIGSAAASERLPNLHKPDASSTDRVVGCKGIREREVTGEYFFDLDVKYT